MHEILATFHGETFCFPGDSANTVIGEFQAEGSPAEKELAEIGIKQKVFSAKGWIDHDSPSLEVGQTYRLHGEWKDYTNRHTGRTTPQFVFRRWIAHIPHSPEGLVKYLALHGKGCNIGPMTARRLVEHFGVESVLQECQDAGKIAALTSATNEEAERFVARIKESEATQNTHVELNNILGKRGFPKSLPDQLVKTWGVEAAKVIQDDPFELLSFRGVGFTLADKLWIDLGKNPFDIHRQTMAVSWMIQTARDGSVWYRVSAIAEKLALMIGSGANARAAIENGLDRARAGEQHGTLATIQTNADGVISQSQNGEEWVADHYLATMERDSAVYIDTAREAGTIDRLTVPADIEPIRDEYLRSLTCARCNRPLTAPMVHVLDGIPYGPYCIKKVDGGSEAITVDRDAWRCEKSEAVECERRLLPTLKIVEESTLWPAVETIEGISDHQREGVNEAFRERIGVLAGSPGTGKTYTIAAVLKAILKAGKIGAHNIGIAAPTGKAAVRLSQSLEDNDIGLRCQTWHRLLSPRKTSEGWQFEHGKHNPFEYRLIIGDESSMPDQSLIHSVLSSLPRNCHMLFTGDTNQLAPVGAGAPFRDMIAAGIPSGHLTEIRRNDGGIVSACADLRDGKPWAHRYVDNWDSNLTITGDRRTEDKHARIIDLVSQAIGDGFDPIWDIQVIVALNEKSELSRKELNRDLQRDFNHQAPEIPGTKFRDGDKVVCLTNGLYRGEGKSNEQYVANGEVGRIDMIDPKTKVARIELRYPERIVLAWLGSNDEKDGKSDAKSWDLGYAITCHKFQGSEAGRVITVLDKAAKRVCDRSWMTTGLSRATDHQYLVGDEQLAEQFCRVLRVEKRKTFLRERILLAELVRKARDL